MPTCYSQSMMGTLYLLYMIELLLQLRLQSLWMIKNYRVDITPRKDTLNLSSSINQAREQAKIWFMFIRGLRRRKYCRGEKCWKRVERVPQRFHVNIALFMHFDGNVFRFNDTICRSEDHFTMGVSFTQGGSPIVRQPTAGRQIRESP